MRKFSIFALVLTLLLALAACQQEPAPIPTTQPAPAIEEDVQEEEPTAVPPTAEPEPTEQPQPEPTEEPQAAEEPTAEPQPTEEPAAEAPASEGLALFGTEVIPCPQQADLSQLSADDVEGETYECGVVKVPENYEDPEGRNFELVYYRFFSTAETPDPVPVLYLSGGPGGAAWHELGYPTLIANMDVIREDRDFIVYDQRGTGLSSPINCSPVHAAIGAAMELLPELSETLTGLESGAKMAVTNYALCAQVLQGTGVDLRQYNSVASTRDMASLMTALGYEQFVPYGTSYGTKLAQVAMREIPERIPMAVLDGTSPLGQPQTANSYAEGNEQFMRIFEQCAADPACNEAYPNLAQRFTDLLNRLQSEPLLIEDPIMPSPWTSALMGKFLGASFPIDSIPPQLFGLFMNGNNVIYNHREGAPKSFLSRMPRIILAIEEGDADYLREVLGGDVAPSSPQASQELSEFPDEQTVQPWNAYVAPTFAAILREAQTAAAVTDQSALDEQWVALVINDLAARLENDADQEEVIRDMINLSILPTLGNDKSDLRDYADENLSAELAAELNALVDEMTSNDVRKTLWHISDVADTMSFAGENAALRNETKLAINCAEDVAFRQDPEIVTELLAQAPYPQLATGGPENYQTDILICKFFPETIIDPSFSEPVESDIPVLLLQGQMDMQTPPSQALEVASHLPNSVYVPINSEGHVVIGKDAPCPGEIAAQFMRDPMGDLDTSCADDFIVDWELP